MTQPRIPVVQHESDGPPGHVGRWLLGTGSLLDVRRPYVEGYDARGRAMSRP